LACYGALNPWVKDVNNPTQTPRWGFTQFEHCLPFLWLLFGIAVIAAGAILGYLGASDLTTAMNNFISSATAIVNSMYNLVVLSYDTQVMVGTQNPSDLRSMAAGFQTTVTDMTTKINDTNAIRTIVVYVFYAVFFVFPFIGVVAYCCGRYCSWCLVKMTACSVCFCWVLLILGWIFFGITFVLGVFMDDTCVQAGLNTYGQANVFGSLIACTVDPTMYNSTWSNYRTAVDAYNTQKTASWPAVPSETAYGLASTTNNYSAVVANNLDYVGNTKLLQGLYVTFNASTNAANGPCLTLNDASAVQLCYVPGVTNSTYSSMCMGSQPSAASQPCMSMNVIAADIAVLAASFIGSCNFQNGISIVLNNNICPPLVKGIAKVSVGQGLISLFYFVVIVAMTSGIIRWDEKNSRDKQDEETQMMKESFVFENCGPNLPLESAIVKPQI